MFENSFLAMFISQVSSMLRDKHCQITWISILIFKHCFMGHYIESVVMLPFRACYQNISILVKKCKSTKDLFGMNAIEWLKLGIQLFSFLFFKEKLQHVLCVFCFALFCFQSLKLSLLLSYWRYFFSANVFFKTIKA